MSEESGNKCPVNHRQHQHPKNEGLMSSSPEASASFWSQFWAFPDAKSSSASSSPPSSCPMSSDGNDSSESILGDSSSSTMPASLEEAARHSQTPQPDQMIILETKRQRSSIPRGDQPAPHHQHDSASATNSSSNWVYPSEQQLYNAMRRKGWQNIPEESIPVVLQIHNNINERTWAKILEWENNCPQLELARFQGRPRDMTPKAFVLSKILRLYDPPFDRHDWYVQHGRSSVQQRYVIDYYYLPPADPNLPPIPYVDARPALDHPRAVWLRSRRFLQDAFPGITDYWKQFQQRQQK